MKDSEKNPLEKAEEKMKNNTRLLEVMIVIAIIIIIGTIFWPVRKTLFNLKLPVAEKNVPVEK